MSQILEDKGTTSLGNMRNCLSSDTVLYPSGME